MAKKKSRKIKRDIEKLFNTGRYWEWLKRVQAENLEGQYPRELDQVWKTLTRKSLRLPANFEEFCSHIQAGVRPTNLPDFNFLAALKRFIEDDGTSLLELKELKGLSPAAAILRERALTWTDKTFPSEKLNKLLNAFSQHPESVTQRHYDQLARVLAGSGLAEQVEMLGEELSDFRRLNYQSTVKKGWRGIHFRDLEEMDRAVANLSENLPEALRHILMLPFCSQIAILMQRLVSQDAADMAGLVGCFRFLFPLLAGDRMEELTRQLMLTSTKSATGLNLSQLKRQIATDPLEDNLVLLNRMRLLLPKESEDEDDLFDLFSSFDDEDDDHSSEELREVFRTLYDRVLDQLAARAAEQPLRESKELRRVMEKVILADLPLLVEDPDDVKELAPLMKRLMDAGCVGKRLALLSLLVARRDRSPSLKTAAEKVLDESPPVSTEDLQWLLNEFDPIYFPRLRALTPLLDRYHNDTTLLDPIFITLFANIEELLVTGKMAAEGGFMSSLMALGSSNLAGELHIVRQELDELKAYQLFDPLRVYISCFPQNRYTQDGFLHWLDLIHNTSGWPTFLKGLMLALSHRWTKAAQVPYDLGSPKQFVEEQVQTLLYFLKAHSEDFRSMDLDVIFELVALLNAFNDVMKLDSTFLSRLSDILHERLQGGEKEAAALQQQLLTLLKQLVRPKQKARKPKRGRR